MLKALILNSGLGSRMGDLTREHPKCMTELGNGETILSRQLNLLLKAGVRQVVITTGYRADALRAYCEQLALPLEITFVHNPRFAETNYIYSIFLARDLVQDDILLLHGDLVFSEEVLRQMLAFPASCMAVSGSLPLPEKDFKAVVRDGQVLRVGVSFFENAVAAQPLYHLKKADWLCWLAEIGAFCEAGDTGVYAENALNALEGKANIAALDIGEKLCAEVDRVEDLAWIQEALRTEAGPLQSTEIVWEPEKSPECQTLESMKPEDILVNSKVFRPKGAWGAIGKPPKTVYLCFSTDIIHGGHIAIIRKAQKLGRLMIGVLSDEAVASYKRFPLVPASERRLMFENIAGVERVVEQKTLSYREVLETWKPDIVVHGDDWVTGFQQPIREEVLAILVSYGGKLVEFPYSSDVTYREIEKRQRADLAMPELRRGRLRKVLAAKGLVTAMEAHDGLTGLVVENTVVHQDGGARQFDAMWLSSLCDSTAKGKPDIELVDMTSRFRTIDDLMEVTTKPIIFDGDTGGLTEHFVYTVRSLERMGVSMVIIEDKTGLKKNSLFGTEVVQTQDSIERFCAKIRAGKNAQRTREFMICARIESLILEQGMEDALARAFAYTAAGADAVMIHSRQKDPEEIKTFLSRFRERDTTTPVVLVPTSFNSVKEEEWKALGANIIIYANQLMRATVPAVRKAAESILENHRAEECEDLLMPFSEIIRMIPESGW